MRGEESNMFQEGTHLGLIYESVSMSEKYKLLEPVIANVLEKGIAVCCDEQNQMDKYTKPPPEKSSSRMSGARTSKNNDSKATDSKESK